MVSTVTVYLFISVFTLIVGWILDNLLGDPACLPHPVVGFGKLISLGERLLNKGKYRMLKGGILTVFLIVAVFLLSYLLLCALWQFSFWLYLIACCILIFYCLAGTTLIREVRMVFKATDRSPEEGRKQLARIVGRDTSQLSAQEIRTAALETLAENLSDGVIAPLFWYFLLGVPGMLTYKMINTLDSMIGYKNERYLLFGRVAARIDDAANYLPARITALLMILVSSEKKLWKFVRIHGKRHISPNSGYPEAALAGILNCRFGGTHNYFGKEVYKPYIGENERTLNSADMETAVKINKDAEIMMVFFIAVLQVLLALLLF